MFEKAKRLAKSKNKKMIAGAAFITMILIATFLQIGADKPLTNTREESDFTQAFLDPPIPPENKIELELSISDLVVEDIYLNEDVYKRISIDDCGYIGQVGHPKLPFKTLKILLPYGKDLDKVNVVPSERYTLDGKFKIEPAQAQIPFGTDEIPKFALAESIYQSANLFPENIYSVEGVYELRGYRILILNIYPVQYIPNTAEISYFKDMKVQVSVSDNTLANSLFRGFYVDEERVISAVDNPEIINTYKGNKEEGKNLPSSSGLSPDSYDYVIITNEALKNSGGAYTFQDLADYKIAHGIQTTIVTVEYIYANYPGDDEQEKIRNFIIDAYQTWNIRYVLLGGDGDGANLGGESEDPIIPARGFYATAYGEVDYNIPSDLYYSGLDGTWDDDGDGIYGEDGEEDFYAEVYVGRAPVDSEEEVSNFVMKTLIHEQINDEYLSKALMVGEDLGWYVWGGDYKDEIKDGSSANGYTTVGFQDTNFAVETLYDREGYWYENDLIPLINDGIHVINHMGHSYVDYNMKMYNDDVDALTNDKYFFGYSQGCYNGAFDNRDDYGSFWQIDSIAEHFVTTQNGAFAVIGNSRYGWGDIYGTDGSSQYYDRQFFDAIFGEDIHEIGKANQDSKEDNIGYISEGAMRWCYYEINLFGDPTTTISKTFKPIDHDLKVSLEIPANSEINNPYLINATVTNVGLTDETDVDFFLFLDGISVASTTISTLQIGESVTINYMWTPTTGGTYNFTAYAPSVSGEINLINNIDTELVRVTFPPIHIDDTAWNNWKWAKSQDWCSGSGIKEDPYVIQDLIIDADGLGNGILIENSNAYFRIDNCEIYNSGTGSEDAGIKLINTGNGKIINNYFQGNSNGIRLEYSYLNIIEENNVNVNIYGIYLYKSHVNTISGNTANDNDYGISLLYSHFNTISENFVDYSDYGIILYNSHSNIISGNTANNNLHFGIILYISDYNRIIEGNTANHNNNGIDLYSSDHNTVSGNTANNNNNGIILRHNNNNIVSGNTVNNNNNGIRLEYSDGNTISGNTVNDNIWGIYLTGSYDNIISGNTAFNNDIVGIYLDISDYNIISGNLVEDNSYGISLFNSHDNIVSENTANNNWRGIDLNSNNNIISGNTVNDNDWGIYLRFSNYNTISGNFVDYNDYGISLSESHNNKIYNNTANYNNRGISLDGNNNNISENTASYNDIYGIYLYNSTNSIIEENTASYNWDGILLYISDYNIISGNIANNNNYGIHLSSSDHNIISVNTANYNLGDEGPYYGIWLYRSNDNDVLGNIASYNDNYGIFVEESHDNTISGNAANDNIEYGIYLRDSDNNTISGNTACNKMTSNQISGIRLVDSDYNRIIEGNNASYNDIFGIHLTSSHNNIVSGNTANDNNVNGIRLRYSNDNTISGNIANKNYYGIYLHFSNYNTGEGNDLSNNVADPYIEMGGTGNDIGYSV